MTTAASHTTPAPPPRVRLLALVLGCEVLLLTLFNTPHERLSRFVYNDSAADLTFRALVARGLRPTIDFGYLYGLLPPLINRAWYGLLGPSPVSFRLVMVVCALLLAWGLARLSVATRAGVVGVAMLVAALPDLMQVGTIVLVHALEPVLLVHALAFQARGRRDAALAVATAELFVKPAMGYVLGFVLVLLILTDRSVAPRDRWKSFVPAALVGAGLAVVLGLAYGPGPLLRTVVPGSAMAVYRLHDYGFFRAAGRSFWLIPGGTLRDYLRYEVGAWLTGTAVLTLGGIAAVVRGARGRGDRRDEVVATCAALHLAFVLLFYGNRGSWAYYYVVPVAGLVAMSGRLQPRWQTVLVGVVAALTLIGGKVKLETTARLWSSDTPVVGTFGLWATPQERAEWVQVLSMTADRSGVVLLARVDGAPVLLPTVFAGPDVYDLAPGHALPAEVGRKAERIARAELVVRVLAKTDPSRGRFDYWPELARSLEGFETAWKGELFEVLRRRHGS